jgi:hypothetical protein
MVAPAFDVCAEFLRSIGIRVEYQPGVSGFLPNVRIKSGVILVDPVDDRVCGSMLHEAGHIAVIPSLFRSDISDDACASVQSAMDAYCEKHVYFLDGLENPIVRGIMQSGESEAIAWSYAAAHEIGVDTTLPFQLGFDGEGAEIHATLGAGCHFGINGLVAGGMTKMRGSEGFPRMTRWMQI